MTAEVFWASAVAEERRKGQNRPFGCEKKKRREKKSLITRIHHGDYPFICGAEYNLCEGSINTPRNIVTVVTRLHEGLLFVGRGTANFEFPIIRYGIP